MVKEYLKRRNIAEHDVRFVFNPGSLVLLKSKEPGRRKVTAVGPYTFIKYLGPLGVVAKVANKAGKLYEVSAANLLPINDSNFNRLMRYDPPPEEDPTTSLEFESTESTLSGSSLGPAIPKGVRLEPTVQQV
jgi:hypothetical protein